MSRPEDTFTSTVDGAAAFERWHGEDHYDDDKPTLADLQEDPEYWARFDTDDDDDEWQPPAP